MVVDWDAFDSGRAVGHGCGLGGSSEWWFGRDTDLADWLVERRTAWLDDVAGWLRTLGSAWFVRLLLAGAALVMAITRRWRHLVTFAAVVLVAEWLASRTSVRPGAVQDLQAGVPMATVAATVVAAGYSLWWPGR